MAAVVSEVGIKVVALEVEKEVQPFLVVLEEEVPVEIEFHPLALDLISSLRERMQYLHGLA